MASTTASTSVWFGELAAAVQGGWQAAMAASHVGQEKKLTMRANGPREQEAPAREAAAAGRKTAEDVDVGRCVGAMSDTTVYLLLDRFAPS
ncbi:hypothetical protein HU200_039869 [Digitaria exilis]|uniref:Uncharacterized protein n=1 Tax=Digitaria exilis TaxID=1010633 RepID=A0A835EKP0_9POAL|nr:hypothetical protein HU200_039869 [Digitaria exilis]